MQGTEDIKICEMELRRAIVENSAVNVEIFLRLDAGYRWSDTFTPGLTPGRNQAMSRMLWDYRIGRVLLAVYD